MRLEYKSKKRKACALGILASLILALLLLTQTALAADSDATEPAVDPVRSNDNYTAVVYDNTNGLPTAEANDIVQTE